MVRSTPMIESSAVTSISLILILGPDPRDVTGIQASPVLGLKRLFLRADALNWTPVTGTGVRGGWG